MASSADARAAVLGRIRKAIGGASSADVARAEWEAIPREFKRAASHERGEVLELLVERLIDYDAHVVVVRPEGVTDAVKSLLEARGVRQLLVPVGMPDGVLPEGFAFVVDAGFGASELDAFDGVVTMATVAIAETGTVVLQNAAGQGRRAATLVPDYHLCVVQATNVVETVPEAMVRLQATASLATTFVSGPSATADIEMTRIKGVHGPRFLDVVVIEDAGSK
ncbi:LutC/YkgG family protein [Granulicella arctica]|uniref:L-lactate dehydrogenase complex protein LldG n=1 Tax=Granulicella arctica TaxID=940613 RepID=A0A7Y9TUK9_9BACT|nr:LUD domain-containing protein [Granulicella arctica]NYF80968.1 L-lactate dehydrogenase complex protein LldG [Granulicella arctica]